ncbi:cytochrome c maturation protein CcmE [Kamptonema cortianum]|nr:cytochrome c maturation protein CcmE [Geitlerinema splendidum]MDK3156341.1 cytochrome c maturation protein CcmE [Kamptonema cortianum]
MEQNAAFRSSKYGLNKTDYWQSAKQWSRKIALVDMKFGPVFGASLSIAALCGVAFVMLNNASPYVTVEQAKHSSGNNLHLQGAIQPKSLKVNAEQQIVSFVLVDESGARMPVLYKGLVPANLNQAETVVAVGGYQSGTFQSHKILTKCPSKYEGQDAKKSESQVKA